VITGLTSEPAGRSDALLPSDVIYSVNDGKVASIPELEKALESAKQGDSVALQIERLGQLQFVVVEVQ
jgi:S1-C subfamily serine protease